ncbi:hypothetical protein SISNIDRAFT_408539 [Sistotremastrum niveocremeum HHB9708]|uniref:L-tryptophan decarboxylase PsiD-like domain-containing protein n=1 Tax=Sistotremastrum niveocremeum HHB9708 TaxID=1314777 RepID=A0A164WXH9_9AGAM|nr:hypothetical protein SISNIDRAFT_408539 [Sistotremastrum niveocremeum HHB9708]
MSTGGWLPEEPDRLNDWIKKKLQELQDDEEKSRSLHPSIVSFKKFIEENSEAYMGFHRLFDNVPDKDPIGRPQVKDYETMLRLFNRFLGEAPEYNADFLVFLPFTAVLQWPMSFANGLIILINPKVNDHFREIFKVWTAFLSSSSSRYVLNEEGWLGPEAMKQMPNFTTTFVCDPQQPYWGFQSWDHFFARTLRTGARPVCSPTDPTVITSACESKVLQITYEVKERDLFWLKGQPYSLTHMLNNSPNVQSFVGGTVYQAFLSPFYYHRWSSPVDGQIEDVQVVNGTYFAGIPYDSPPGMDEVALQGQQPFLSHVATRALIFIRATDARIGLICFVGVGMVEVSSCEITVKKGDKVKKGDEIGTFHFGGSTHCLVFGPELARRLKFSVQKGDLVEVHSKIAQLT